MRSEGVVRGRSARARHRAEQRGPAEPGGHRLQDGGDVGVAGQDLGRQAGQLSPVGSGDGALRAGAAAGEDDPGDGRIQQRGAQVAGPQRVVPGQVAAHAARVARGAENDRVQPGEPQRVQPDGEFGLRGGAADGQHRDPVTRPQRRRPGQRLQSPARLVCHGQRSVLPSVVPVAPIASPAASPVAALAGWPGTARPARWQAARSAGPAPAGTRAASTGTGSPWHSRASGPAGSCCASSGHRGWNRQPPGIAVASGGSPPSAARGRPGCRRAAPTPGPGCRGAAG